MKVYILQHEHELEDDTTDIKLIGVYSSQIEAVAAQNRVINAPGFDEHRNGFSIDAYELGQDHWTQGFRTVRSRDGSRAETEAA